MPKVIGGRYGLSSKEFTPAMVGAVFDELTKAQPQKQFTVGIVDDVTHLSLDYDPDFSTEKDDVSGRCSSASAATAPWRQSELGEDHRREHAAHAQGYFVYDSKKAGSVTTSHLRFGPRPISSYLIHRANFVACHQFHFLSGSTCCRWPTRRRRSC